MSGAARGRAGYPLALGASAILLLLLAVGGWGVGTTLAGAVVAPGHLEAEGERQAIEHAEGGVLAEILARDGDRVAAGAVLLRLDGTFLRSELAIVEGQLAEIHVRSARLRAERDGADLPAFDGAPGLDTVDAAALAALAEGERALFRARLDAQAGALRQIGTQRVQLGRRIEGLGAQSAALARERALLGEQIADLAALVDRGLAEAGRLSALRREAARLDGAGANLAAEMAAAEAEIAALDLEALRLADLRREEAIARLRDLGAMRFELEQRQLGLRERIARLEVRAPVAGTVFGSRIAAEGSVVRPGAATMFLLPEGRRLRVVARIDPSDADQVRPGQEVALVLAALDRGMAPELRGRVVTLSADAERDAATGAAHYRAVIEPDAAVLADLPGLRPGMPVEAFLRTADRTPLSYLAEPLVRYFRRAFRAG